MPDGFCIFWNYGQRRRRRITGTVVQQLYQGFRIYIAEDPTELNASNMNLSSSWCTKQCWIKEAAATERQLQTLHFAVLFCIDQCVCIVNVGISCTGTFSLEGDKNEKTKPCFYQADPLSLTQGDFPRWHPREYDWHKVRAHTKNAHSLFQITCIHRKEPFCHRHTLSDYLGFYLCRIWRKAFVPSSLEAELRQKPKTNAGKTRDQEGPYRGLINL